MFSATPTGEWNHCGVPRAREQSKFGYQSCPRSFGSHVTVQCQSIHPYAHTTGQQCEISHFFAGVRACNLILYIRVVVNWLLSKQSMHWPVSDDLFAGRGVDPSRLRVFMKLSAEYSIPSARALPLALIKSIYYKSSVTRPKRKQCWLNGERMLIHLSILSSPSLAI